MEKIKKRIFDIIELADENDRLSNVYDIFMMLVIILSLVPLMFKEETTFFYIIDKVTLAVFIIDYILRLWTADLKMRKGKVSYILYPITPMAIIDLLSILPSISLISNSLKILKIFRLFRTLRVFRVFKFVRYSRTIKIIGNVIKNQKKPLITVGMMAVAYILVSAMVVFNVEPESFKNYFEAVYWATISLTTMGYGDISPVTTIGRAVTIVSALIGIAVIALPSGIITAGFMDELYKDDGEINDK